MSDIMMSITVMLFSLFIYVSSGSFSMTGKNAWSISKNAAVYPRLLAILMFTLGLVLLFNILRKGPLKKLSVDKEALLNVAKIAGLVLLYVISVFFIGFIIATTLFLFITILVTGGKRRSALIVPLPITLGLYLVFKVIFAVPLPIGEIFNLWR